jgi:small ligand-binding sensory domain FIST
VLLELDGQPALDVLLEDLKTSLEEPRERMLSKIRNTLAGIGGRLDQMTNKAGALQDNTIVRHIIGLDLQRKGVALAHELQVGMQLNFCERNAKAAKADLMRIGAEIREALEPQELSPMEAEMLNDSTLDNSPQRTSKIAGAIYVSCAARGGPHFGSSSAELQILNRALGDVPLTGFFAAGEVAQNNLYGYTGVLTVFVMD